MEKKLERMGAGGRLFVLDLRIFSGSAAQFSYL